MTKEDALQKIEELKQFVADLDKREQLGHGDLVHYPGEPEDKRIVVDVSKIKSSSLKHKFVLLNKEGYDVNSFTEMPDLKIVYTKIRNVFDGK